MGRLSNKAAGPVLSGKRIEATKRFSFVFSDWKIGLASRHATTAQVALWGYNAIPFTRTVDMHIAKLRKKIEDDPADPRHIVTVHRLGYKLTG